MSKTTYKERLQDGVMLTVEVDNENTDVDIKDNEHYPEDRIEVCNSDTGALTRVEVVQNKKAEAYGR